ncbi:MAG TPA: zinc ribbon domain-containing protein [Tepidiformaceae bacterium]|nr:zinc ribbon domain-containing protein [Tepidiformaceae bacterium]
MELVSWPGGSWEATLKMAIAVVAIYLAAIWITLIFWTYRDVRQRTRDPIMQSVAVLLVLFFFLPGHWIYLILRPRLTLAEAYERSLEEEALLQELEDQKSCPSCKRRVYDEYLICPSCRTQLKEPCRQCSKPLSYAWVSCPYCALEKPARQPAMTRPQRPMGPPRTPDSLPPPVRRSPGNRPPPRVSAPETIETPAPAAPAGSTTPAAPVGSAAAAQTSTETVAPRRPRTVDPFATPRAAEARPIVAPTEDGAVIDATPHETNGQTPKESTS